MPGLCDAGNGTQGCMHGQRMVPTELHLQRNAFMLLKPFKAAVDIPHLKPVFRRELKVFDMDGKCCVSTCCHTHSFSEKVTRVHFLLF